MLIVCAEIGVEHRASSSLSIVNTPTYVKDVHPVHKPNPTHK